MQNKTIEFHFMPIRLAKNIKFDSSDAARMFTAGGSLNKDNFFGGHCAILITILNARTL